MLTHTLRNLERDGPETRTVRPTVPPKAEDALSPVAHESHDTLQRLTDRAGRNRVYVAEARAACDAEHRPDPFDAQALSSNSRLPRDAMHALSPRRPRPEYTQYEGQGPALPQPSAGGTPRART